MLLYYISLLFFLSILHYDDVFAKTPEHKLASLDRQTNIEFGHPFIAPDLPLNSTNNLLQYLDLILQFMQNNRSNPLQFTMNINNNDPETPRLVNDIANEDSIKKDYGAQEFIDMFEEYNERSFYFSKVNFDQVENVPLQEMIPNVLNQTMSQKNHLGDLPLKEGPLMRILTLQQMLSLDANSRPAIVLSSEDLNEISALRNDSVMSPIILHGVLACESMAISAIEMFILPSRARECVLQNKYRLLKESQENSHRNEAEMVYLELEQLRGKIDKSNQVNPNSLVAVRNARIDKQGLISFQNYQIQPLTPCEFFRFQHPNNLSKSFFKSIENVIFVSSTLYSHTRYHDFMESASRILPYKDYLKSSDIKIHVGPMFNFSKKILTELFEFDESQFISGEVDARVAIYPTPSPYCYFPGPRNVRLYSSYVHSYLESKNLTHLEANQKRILVVDRKKGPRSVINHQDLINSLRDSFPEHEVVTYSKSPKKFLELFHMFYQADVVIAPHGMGLSNLLACRPGTIVIEYLVTGLPNLCFAKLGQALGMDYHVIMNERGEDHNLELRVDVGRTIMFLKDLLVLRRQYT